MVWNWLCGFKRAIGRGERDAFVLCFWGGIFYAFKEVMGEEID